MGLYKTFGGEWVLGENLFNHNDIVPEMPCLRSCNCGLRDATLILKLAELHRL